MKVAAEDFVFYYKHSTSARYVGPIAFLKATYATTDTSPAFDFGLIQNGLACRKVLSWFYSCHVNSG